MGTPTGSTPTGSSPTGSSAGSTPAASTSSGTTVAPTTESVEALSQKVNEAAETKAAAEEVGSALGEINLDAFVTRLRNKRQATTTTYATPSHWMVQMTPRTTQPRL